MAGWKSVKNLFWVGSPPPSESPQADAGAELSDEEFAAMMAGQPESVPPGEADRLSAAQAVQGDPGANGTVQIDFQAQYDQAGIPNTDEVEQLEAFLTRLDGSLPLTSKVAAAEAFLGAVGKNRQAVLQDAERKIKRVRGLLAAHEQETKNQLAQEQSEIDALMQQIDTHRKKIEDLNRLTEGVRKTCQIEEARLQAAHVFFSNVAPAGK